MFLTDWFGSKNEGPGEQKYYGGSKEASAAEQARYGARGDSAADRGGVMIGDQGQAYGADQQRQAMGMAQQAAMGNAPSVAALQQQQGLGQAIRAQMAMAAGARGGAMAQAAARDQAQQQGAMMQGQAVNQAAQLRAGEMAQARGEYGQQASQYRGQSADQAYHQAAMDDAQRARNDAQQQFYEQQRAGVNAANLQAGIAQQGAAAQAAAQNSATNQANTMGIIKAAATAGGGVAAASDVNAKTDIQPGGVPGVGLSSLSSVGADVGDDVGDVVGRVVGGQGRSFGPSKAPENYVALAQRVQSTRADKLGGAIDYGSNANYSDWKLKSDIASPSPSYTKKGLASMPLTASDAKGMGTKGADGIKYTEPMPEAKGSALASVLGGIGDVADDWSKASQKVTDHYMFSDTRVKKDAAFAQGAEAAVQALRARQAAPVVREAQAMGQSIVDELEGRTPPKPPPLRHFAPSAPRGAPRAPIPQTTPDMDREAEEYFATHQGRLAMAEPPRRIPGTFDDNNYVVTTTSDERAKSQPKTGAIDVLLDTLAGSNATYKYKDPGHQPVSTAKSPEQRYAGVMAQDLERVPELGSGLVSDTPKGKVVEIPAMVSALSAAVGRQQQQLRALAGRRGK